MRPPTLNTATPSPKGVFDRSRQTRAQLEQLVPGHEVGGFL